jgi:beta-phosphoglucomutase
MPEAVIFDYNGTMVNDEIYHNDAWNLFMERHIGRKLTDSEMDQYIHGIHADVTIRRFLGADLPDAEVARLVAEKEATYREICLSHIDIYKLRDGLPEYLDRLKAAGVKLGIATSSPIENVEFYFKHIPLKRWFTMEQVTYNDHSFPGKPAPDIFIKAAEKLHADIHKSYVFEDAKSGVQAGVAAGAERVIALDVTADRQELLKLGADQVIHSYRELL